MESNSIPGKTTAPANKDGTAAAGGDDIVAAVDKGGPDAVFTFDKKGYDPINRAFHRVKSRNYDRGADAGAPTKGIVTGRGYNCGCRSPDDFQTSELFAAIVDAAVEGLETAVLAEVPGAKEALDKLDEQFPDEEGKTLKQQIKDFLGNTIEGAFFRSFMVHIPAWVPVNRVGYGPTFLPKDAHNIADQPAGATEAVTAPELEVEVEGFLTRSYLTRHHRPYTQWSNYYHWSFQVEPATGYKHLIGAGNVIAPNERTARNGAPGIDGNRLYLEGAAPNTRKSLECLFDLGTLSAPPGDRQPVNIAQTPSIMFHNAWPFWPQSGDYFWASGRYVYDCTHATSSLRTGAGAGLHPTMLNPIKAFAVTRYEGFKFDELDEFVPATRFMFYASKRGGYVDFGSTSDIKITDVDYEFIVDLPPFEDDINEFAVGRTPDFNLNTIVARPRLLKNIAVAPYGAIGDQMPTFAQENSAAMPEIQLLRPEPGKLPRQVRVKIPMSKLESDREAIGFVLTLGWADDRQIAKVKKVAVKFPRLIVRDRTEQLRFHFCVNGRWIFFPTAKPGFSRNFPGQFNDIRDGEQQRPGPDGLILHMPDDGFVKVTAHGTRRNALGELMDERVRVRGDRNDRRLFVGGLVEIDDETVEVIRDILKEKLGENIPDGVLDDIDKLKELLSNEELRELLGSALGDLIGVRRAVDWKRDVDSLEADVEKQHQLASAIAREMKVFPVLNKANEAMGMVEEDLRPNNNTPPIISKPTTILMSNLAARINLTITPLELDYHALDAVHPEETGYLFVKTNGEEKEIGDYVLHLTMTPTEQDPPK